MKRERKRFKRRAMTLMEIMIVIVLIGIIGGVVAFNMRGGLDAGKKFKTIHAHDQVYNILMMEIAKGSCEIETIDQTWENVLKDSPYAGKAKELVTDGWKTRWTVTRVTNKDDIVITSPRYVEIMASNDTANSTVATSS